MFPSMNFKAIYCPKKTCQLGIFCHFSHDKPPPICTSTVSKSISIRKSLSKEQQEFKSDTKSIKLEQKKSQTILSSSTDKEIKGRVKDLEMIRRRSIDKQSQKIQVQFPRESNGQKRIKLDSPNTQESTIKPKLTKVYLNRHPTNPSSKLSCPIIQPSFDSQIKIISRQKAVSKFYEEFVRIYQNLNKLELAYDHATKQELALCSISNDKSYMNLAMGILRRLRSRPLANNDFDVGIDGEWTLQKVEENIVPYDTLKALVLSADELKLYDYPTIESVNDNSKLDSSSNQNCDRCNEKYTPESDPKIQECQYHWGRLRSIKGQKFHTCCQGELGSIGCSTGPHVFKDDFDYDLNIKIPFKTLSTNPDPKHKVLAFDCEMCYTTGGFELVRVTIVDYFGTKILDKFVKPDNPILCYNTKFSGVKESDLNGPDVMNLAQVQEYFQSIANVDTILMGHGLENDLRQIRLLHSNIVDTAALYPHPSGMPYRYSLKLLTQTVLGRFIQEGQHDSLEDTLAVLDLVKEYIKKTP
ncbi:hypothetical protein BC833DRAFT_595436 [Globomyces pollinis-pini]|nr:hypothetical protein BC833DRAFT_595436 [Globomyces pollinis-pini]